MPLRAEKKRENGDLRRQPNQTPPQLTRIRRVAVLEAIEREGNIVRASKLTGIEPRTVYKWAEQSETFAEKLREAKAKGERALVDRYEEYIDKRAFSGPKDQHSALYTFFRVKALDHRYRDNVSVNVAAAGPVAIMIGVDTPPDVVEADAKAIAPAEQRK